MLKSEGKYQFLESVVLKKFKSNLVDLIIEAASNTDTTNSSPLDMALVTIFLNEIKEANKSKSNNLSDYYLISELLENVEVSGIPLNSITDESQVSNLDRAEFLKALQHLHTKINEVSTQLNTPSSGLFLVR